MAPKYQTNARVQKEALKKQVAKDFALLTRDGSAKTAVYNLLSERYGLSPSTVRNYALGIR